VTFVTSNIQAICDDTLVLLNGREKDLTMVTPIDAVRFHSTFGEADYWLQAQDRDDPSSQTDEDGDLAPAHGALLGLVLGSLMWAGLIVGFRAIFGV
jgi:hypothetical protein